MTLDTLAPERDPHTPRVIVYLGGWRRGGHGEEPAARSESASEASAEAVEPNITHANISTKHKLTNFT